MALDPENFTDKKSFKNKGPEAHRRGHKIKRDDGPRVFDLPCQRTINVRIRYGGHILTYDCGDLQLDIGDWVVIRDLDVLRMGLVTSKPIIWPADQTKNPILLPSDRRLLRVATDDDLAKQAENQLKERENFEYCQSCIVSQSLSMKLVAVEITFDFFKTIFYYTAEERVDFRQLVKELVSRLRTRIEMRQIGVRNEAMMLGGMGICGRHFCCAGFLNNFSPVSVKMAKEQNLSLNTAKISGVCGRLMCCLAFENYLTQSESDISGLDLNSFDEDPSQLNRPPDSESRNVGAGEVPLQKENDSVPASCAEQAAAEEAAAGKTAAQATANDGDGNAAPDESSNEVSSMSIDSASETTRQPNQQPN
jgi:cell fate regulator YaaT (PSP1 superfamily)